jgi:putative peptide zinc metalloprotease protein
MAGAPFEVVLPDRTRVPVERTLTIGRATDCAVRLEDRTVSRRHVRLSPVEGGVVVEDIGSTYGTWVDGERVRAPTTLRDGAVVRVGDEVLVLERGRAENESRRTFVVGLDASALRPAVGATSRGPRLRSGYAVKRLEASEGDQRWVLRELRGDRFLRLSAEGELLELLDGRRSVTELMAEAERRLGAAGPARLAGMLAELADRGLLAGTEGEAPAALPDAPARRRGVRERAWPGAPRFVAGVYAHGGAALFTPFALALLAAVATTGLASFGYLVVERYGTPFVVASHLGFGGVVFIVGRVALASVHELAHALTMARFGRRVGRAGFKMVLIFPYLFVDTSEAWFLPRRRRIAVSAAGPTADAVLGGLFAWVCLLLAPGALRDIAFQLAFGAYMAALVNLNPFVERDGYHVLCDVLREPSLRRRARAELRRVWGRRGGAPPSPVLTRYAIAGLAWSCVAAGAAIAMSLRYAPALEAVVPAWATWLVLGSVWVAAASPAVVTLGGPLWDRMRGEGKGDAGP